MMIQPENRGWSGKYISTSKKFHHIVDCGFYCSWGDLEHALQGPAGSGPCTVSHSPCFLPSSLLDFVLVPLK